MVALYCLIWYNYTSDESWRSLFAESSLTFVLKQTQKFKSSYSLFKKILRIAEKATNISYLSTISIMTNERIQHLSP